MSSAYVSPAPRPPSGPEGLPAPVTNGPPSARSPGPPGPPIATPNGYPQRGPPPGAMPTQGPPNGPPMPPGGPPNPHTIQRMLDENAALIKTITEYQNNGKHSETVQYQWSLHRNLIYLASIADSNQNLQNLLPVSQCNQNV